MISSPETERYAIAALLRFPALMGDITAFVHEADFSSGKLNRTIYGAFLDAQKKGEDLNEFSVATKIKNAGISFSELEGGDVLDYLKQLRSMPINETAGVGFFKELKRISVAREMWEVGAELQKQAKAASKDTSAEQMLGIMDQIYGAKMGSFETVLSKDFSNIYEEVEEIIEERGNNPITDFGLMGPFERVNQIYGSLLRPGNITLIGARQNVGKSSIGNYYLTHVAERHNVPILHLDAGEMSEFELQMRSVCMLTEGKVPMTYLEDGSWRQSETLTKLVREAWPKVRKMKDIGCFYKNIGGLSPDEICSVIRRFYWGKIGRGNQFVIHYDYLKSFESFGANSPEWQQMGYFIQKIKTLITNEIPVPIWTSIQLNKSGITGNKSGDQIDNTESTFSISDRIIQQASHAFLLRMKTLEEVAAEPNLGNAKMFNVKKRHLGKDFRAALDPVKMADGSLRANYIMLNADSFVFSEVGDLATLKDKVGVAPLEEDEDSDRNPRDPDRDKALIS